MCIRDRSYIQGLLNPERKKPAGEEKEKQIVDPNVREARDRLQRALGLKVSIEDQNGRGRVIIEYSRLEDFDALLEDVYKRQSTANGWSNLSETT